MEKRIINFVYFSRFLMIIAQFISNKLIPDHQADAFTYPVLNNSNYVDKIVTETLGGFLRWDAQYFMHIACYGYTYENTIVFFPLFPLTVGYWGQGFHLLGMGSINSIVLVLFILFNIYMFKLAALALYDLTRELFNEKLAYNATLVFCLNPASIFFIAPYTETLFSYLTFKAIYYSIKFYRNEHHSIVPLISFINLSILTRSNGIINIGFLLYAAICRAKKSTLKTKVSLLFLSIRATFLCLLPFLVYQLFCYKRFCQNESLELPEIVIEHAKINKLIIPNQLKDWCNNSSINILPYSYVQNHYWNVGFLNYYEFKQIPNFLLALPILLIMLTETFKHIYFNFFKLKNYNIFNLDDKNNFKDHLNGNQLYHPKLNVFHYHALFLTLFCIFFIHIQVSTRFLCSSSPIFYWICAQNVDILKWYKSKNCKKSGL